MNLYEFINMSDTITFYAPDDDIAFTVTMYVGNGELSPLPRDFDDYADRIKKAIESEVEPMRKALKEIRDMAVAGVYDGTCDCHEIIRVAEVALGERKE